jgi:putative membrane protein
VCNRPSDTKRDQAAPRSSLPKPPALLLPAILMAIILWSSPPAAAASPADRAFLRNELQASVHEQEFARIGLARSLRPEIRAYAETLIADHAQANEALRDLARSRNVPPAPPLRNRQQLDRLRNIPAHTFDAAFLREARRINGDAIRTVQAEAAHTSDPEIRALALQALDMDKKHQDQARAMSDIIIASRPATIRPPRTGDPIVVAPPPDKTPMPIIRPRSDVQQARPGRD